MHTLAIAWFICFLTMDKEAHPIVVQSEATLKWADKNPPETSDHFLVQVYAGDLMVHSQLVSGPQVKMEAVLGRLIPGQYSVRILTISPRGVPSHPSRPILVNWVGRGLG
jgi:hypothetical protein